MQSHICMFCSLTSEERHLVLILKQNLNDNYLSKCQKVQLFSISNLCELKQKVNA